jgi:ATP-dependent DNA helicase UvrD/PcrA
LRYRGIPYRLVGAVSFYERREVKDLLAYLRLVVNPADDEAFLRVVNVPRRGIGEASLDLLVRTATRWRLPLTAAAAAGDRIPELRPNLREALQAVAALIAGLREQWGQADPATVLERVIVATGYERYLADEGAEGVDRLENVQELVAGAAEWAELAVAGNGDEPATLLERYLTQVALVTPADAAAGAEAPSGVTLMTVHMAKGLEWSMVALTGLEDGLFPLGRSVGVPGGLEEERRLCYVGLTRAREKLYLSWARTRYRNGRLELSEPSRFLESVPSRVVDEKSTSVRWDRPIRGRPAVARAGDVRWDEEPSQDAPRYASGERVRHRKFGAGVVRAVAGSGRGLKVTVEFDAPDIGTKQLLVAYAGLEREWESA